jgi:RNA polymerase sigma-70 factor (ECF subfamily)
MSGEPSLSGIFVALALEPELRDLCGDLVARAQAAHPTVRADVGRFAEKLVQQATQEGRREPALLLSLRAPDLWLAFGCAARDPGALARFDAVFRDEFDVVHRRVRPRGIDRDDFVQIAREKLFVKEPPKIAEYSGQGDLRNWLRVTLTRTLLDMSRKRQEEPASDPDSAGGQGFQLPAPGKDPELDFMQAHYKDAFRQAFERAARSLETDDRNLLRQHFVHGLGIDQLSGLLGVHRATAARRIGKARDELMDRTRRELMVALNLSASELDSVMRFVESQVHLTVERVLGPTVEG